MLFDRVHQSVSFDDMVLVVQSSPGSQVTFDLKCDGESVSGFGGDPRQALTFGLLSTLFGVAAPHEAWDPPHARPRHDYTFAACSPPFARILGNDDRITFAQMDARWKNRVYTILDSMLENLEKDFKKFIQYKLELDDIMESNINVEEGMIMIPPQTQTIQSKTKEEEEEKEGKEGKEGQEEDKEGESRWCPSYFWPQAQAC